MPGRLHSPAPPIASRAATGRIGLILNTSMFHVKRQAFTKLARSSQKTITPRATEPFISSRKPSLISSNL